MDTGESDHFHLGQRVRTIETPPLSDVRAVPSLSDGVIVGLLQEELDVQRCLVRFHIWIPSTCLQQSAASAEQGAQSAVIDFAPLSTVAHCKAGTMIESAYNCESPPSLDKSADDENDDNDDDNAGASLETPRRIVQSTTTSHEHSDHLTDFWQHGICTAGSDLQIKRQEECAEDGLSDSLDAESRLSDDYPSTLGGSRASRRKTRGAFSSANVEQKEPSYSCDLCPLTFHRAKILNRHVISRHVGARFACLRCGRCCTGIHPLWKHYIKMHAMNTPIRPAHFNVVARDRTVDVGNCMYQWLDFDGDVPTTVLPRPCNSCALRFRTSSAWLAHRRQAHDEQLSQRRCDDCGKEFCSDLQLARHCLNAHSTDRTWPCDLCERSFAFKLKLTLHKNDVHGPLRYECEECGQRSRNRKHFTQHTGTHAREKLYRCDVCDRKYFSNGRRWLCRARHKRGDRSYECENCGKRFNTRSNLTQHESIHAGRMPFCCLTCQRCFRTVGNLINHEAIHSGLTRWCANCKKNFRTIAELRQHRRGPSCLL